MLKWSKKGVKFLMEIKEITLNNIKYSRILIASININCSTNRNWSNSRIENQ